MLYQMLHKKKHQLVFIILFQGSHRLEKFLNIEGFLDIEVLDNELCLEKYLKNHPKVCCVSIYAAPNKGTTI